MPYTPQIVQGQFVKQRPVGQYDSLPPVNTGEADMTDQELRAPLKYLKATHVQKLALMEKFVHNHFSKMQKVHANTASTFAVSFMELVQVLRHECSTTKCPHFKHDEKNPMNKVRSVEFQHALSRVDSTSSPILGTDEII